MDNEKDLRSSANDEAEEVVFNGPAPKENAEPANDDGGVTFAGTVKTEDKSQESTKTAPLSTDDQSEDSVVFASSDTTVKRHAAKKIKKAKKIHKAPVIIASLGFIAAAAGGIGFALKYTRQS